MFNIGRLAEDAGDVASAKSWYQKSADLVNQYAIDALVKLNAP